MKMELLPQENEYKPRVRIIPAKVDMICENGEKVKKRVCAYCRVSTDQEEQRSSYNLQIAHYTEFIKSNDEWQFRGIFADEGITGTSVKNRIQFQKMIEKCKNGEIDLIITKSISRFARNTLDCLQYVRLLKTLPRPVGVYFEKENIDTLDSKSELLMTILSSLAQDESRSISENIKWANQKRFQQGKAHCPTKFLLGYDTDQNGNMVINEEQAQTVRRIYREFLEGKGVTLIAKELERDGLKTGQGKTKWIGNSVHRILKNEKYCGDVLMLKRVTTDFLTHKREKNVGQQPQYFAENHHPAIVSKEDWNMVQVELERRYHMQKKQQYEKGFNQKHSNRSAFSNILNCGHCGEPFIRRTLTSIMRGEKYLYGAWRCRVSDGRKKGHVCRAIGYREVALEHTFMVMLQEMKKNQDSFIKDAEEAINNIALDEWEKKRVANLRDEIKTLEKRLSEMSSASRKRLTGDVYDSMTIKITRKMETLRTELKEMEDKKYRGLVLQKNLSWLLEELTKLQEFEPVKDIVEFREDIFKRIVKKGEVYADGNVVYELNIGIKRTSKGNGNKKIWKSYF
jgi:site-specific DNA recombinase